MGSKINGCGPTDVSDGREDTYKLHVDERLGTADKGLRYKPRQNYVEKVTRAKIPQLIFLWPLGGRGYGQTLGNNHRFVHAKYEPIWRSERPVRLDFSE